MDELKDKFSEELIAHYRTGHGAGDKTIARILEAVNALEASRKAGAEKVDILDVALGTDIVALRMRLEALEYKTQSYPEWLHDHTHALKDGDTVSKPFPRAPGHLGAEPCPDCQKSCENCGHPFCGRQHLVKTIREQCLTQDYKHWTPKSEKADFVQVVPGSFRGCSNCKTHPDNCTVMATCRATKFSFWREQECYQPQPDSTNGLKCGILKQTDTVYSANATSQPQLGETAWHYLPVKVLGTQAYKGAFEVVEIVTSDGQHMFCFRKELVPTADLKRREE